MKPMYAISLSLYALGYWLVWFYAPEPTSRVSNGFHPLGLLGGLVEVVAGVLLLATLGERYASWAMLKPKRFQGRLLAGWLVLLGVAALLCQSNWMAFRERLSPMGSSLRFYLATPWPIALVVCLVGTWLTYWGWKETRTGG